MNYAVLTDISTAATIMMQGFSPAPQLVQTFSAHNLWIWENALEADVVTMQNSGTVYAAVVIPLPL